MRQRHEDTAYDHVESIKKAKVAEIFALTRQNPALPKIGNEIVELKPRAGKSWERHNYIF